MTLLGAVLAGGRSSRFGSDKALADLDGRPLIAHAAASIAGAVDAIVLCGRGATAGYPGTPDWPAPDLGPLGGICGALRFAREHGHEAVLSTGCDTPALARDLVARLAACDGPCFVRQAPMIGRWPVALFAGLERHLAETEERSVWRWAVIVGAEPIDAVGVIANVNRPQDLVDHAMRPRA